MSVSKLWRMELIFVMLDRRSIVWHGFEQSVVNDADDKWCKHLCVDIRVKVGNFEHLIAPDVAAVVLSFIYDNAPNYKCNNSATDETHNAPTSQISVKLNNPQFTVENMQFWGLMF